MNNPINISGNSLESRLEEFLKSKGLPYVRNSNGVDFIVGGGQYYIECKNQTQGGSVNEKLPIVREHRSAKNGFPKVVGKIYIILKGG